MALPAHHHNVSPQQRQLQLVASKRAAARPCVLRVLVQRIILRHQQVPAAHL